MHFHYKNTSECNFILLNAVLHISIIKKSIAKIIYNASFSEQK